MAYVNIYNYCQNLIRSDDIREWLAAEDSVA